jgi:hypothetical protein
VVILGGVQLMATSVIGEYIARIYVQAQARPLYNVAERINFGEVEAGVAVEGIGSPARSSHPLESSSAVAPASEVALAKGLR